MSIFRWTSGPAKAGHYSVRLRAKKAGQRAHEIADLGDVGVAGDEDEGVSIDRARAALE